ncbi:MAG TPA: hypothetical protein VGH29_04785 [Candidatus Binataceae bacterium]|jgi:hypothetical protein
METVKELNDTIDLADEHTRMLMAEIEMLTAHRDALDRALVEAVKIDLGHRIEIEALKIKLADKAGMGDDKSG